MVDSRDVLKATIDRESQLHGRVCVINLIRYGKKELFFVINDEMIKLVEYNIRTRKIKEIRQRYISHIYDTVDGIVNTDCNREREDNFTVGVLYGNVVRVADKDYYGKRITMTKTKIARMLIEQLLNSFSIFSDSGVSFSFSKGVHIGLKALFEMFDERLTRAYSTIMMFMEERLYDFVMEVFEDCIDER